MTSTSENYYKLKRSGVPAGSVRAEIVHMPEDRMDALIKAADARGCSFARILAEAWSHAGPELADQRREGAGG